MDTKINQRIQEIADKLCDGNISELARITDIKQPALRDVVGHKKVKPRSDMLTKIAESTALQINHTWLLTGRGSMQTHNINIVHNPPYRDVGRGVIPIYDINAAANLHTLFSSDRQNLLGEISIPNAPACDGAIYVRGDSMYPLVKSGDMIAYKQVNNLDSFLSGEIYLIDYHIDGDDYLVVKYVELQVEENSKTLRLMSYNKHHQDMVIPVAAVRSIALVKIVISINAMF